MLLTNRFREEEAIRPTQPGRGRRSLVDDELLAQGEVLQSELAVAAEEEREESKQVEQEGDHRAEILSGSVPTDQRLAAGRGFGEGQAISPAKLGSAHRSLVHGQLLVQGEVLEGELAMATEEEREEPKQVEQEGDHRAGIVAGSEPIDQPHARRTEFWRRTGQRCARAAECAGAEPGQGGGGATRGWTPSRIPPACGVSRSAQ